MAQVVASEITAKAAGRETEVRAVLEDHRCQETEISRDRMEVTVTEKCRGQMEGMSVERCQDLVKEKMNKNRVKMHRIRMGIRIQRKKTIQNQKPVWWMTV